MKILSLTASNFLTLGEGVRIYLADRGLNVVQGVNLEDSSATSNGSGKSSILDALCWTLYGTTARDEKGDAVINDRVGKNTVCSVELLNGEAGYRITRHRKHKEHKNQLHIEAFPSAAAMLPGATGVRLDKGTEAESQEVLVKILGCSHEVFVSAVYSGQEAMPDLPRKTDRELKSLIEEAAGLQRIEAAYKVALSRANARKMDVAGLQLKIDNAELVRLRAESDLAVKSAQRLEWEDQRGDRIAAAEAALADAERDLATVSAAVETAAAAEPKLVEAKKKLQDVLGGHEAARSAAAAAAAAAQAADRAVDRTAVGIAAREIETIDSKIAGAREHMGTPCIECGKPHTEVELAEYLEIQRGARAKAVERALKVRERVREQLALAAEKQAEADRLLAAIPDVSEVSAKLGVVNERLVSLAGMRTTMTRAAGLATSRRDALAAIRSAVNPHDSAIETLERQRGEAEKSLVELRLKLAEAQQALANAEAVVKVFGPAGVRAQILDTVTPYLNSRTASYLSVLSDGGITATWTTLSKLSSGELREKFSIEVVNSRGAKSFKGLSGGEKRKVRLACSLALQDLVASRAANPIELWIGDEIDDAMDEAGLERLMTVLEGKARERGTVLVISHNSLTDWCDQTTTVTKEPSGLARVEGALVEG